MVAAPPKKDVQSNPQSASMPQSFQHSSPAKKKFVFNSSAHLLRIGTERAQDLSDLLEGIRTVPDSSIFQHMFQTLAEHHYIREGFSNDFAHWAFFSCNETGLAERLAGVDVREYTSSSTPMTSHSGWKRSLAWANWQTASKPLISTRPRLRACGAR
jgi:hypothetical protein